MTDAANTPAGSSSNSGGGGEDNGIKAPSKKRSRHSLSTSSSSSSSSSSAEPCTTLAVLPSLERPQLEKTIEDMLKTMPVKFAETLRDFEGQAARGGMTVDEAGTKLDMIPQAARGVVLLKGTEVVQKAFSTPAVRGRERRILRGLLDFADQVRAAPFEKMAAETMDRIRAAAAERPASTSTSTTASRPASAPTTQLSAPGFRYSLSITFWNIVLR